MIGYLVQEIIALVGDFLICFGYQNASAMGLSVASDNVLYVLDSTAANLVYRTVNPNQENTAAGGAPTFNTMNFGTVSGTTGADVLTKLAVLSATAGDTVLVMDTGTTPLATPALVTGGVQGFIEGFVDTMAVAPTKLVPANNAVVNLPGTTMNVTLSWAAVTGATSYDVVVNGSWLLLPVNLSPQTLTLTRWLLITALPILGVCTFMALELQ